MSTLRRLLIALATFVVLLLGLSSCGNKDTVAKIAGHSTSITKPTLDHWMRAMVNGDFRANVGTKAPEGLVSEPANFRGCAEAAKRIIPRSFTGRLKIGSAQISEKCHQLYYAIKAQALAFLLSVRWAELEAKEARITISSAEFHKEFQRFRKEYYGSPAAERSYLTERHWVQADVLYMFKRNMLTRRLAPKFEAEVATAGGGERSYARLYLKRYHDQVAKTSCEPGYVVLGCHGYREPAVALPSPSVILESFTQGAVG